MGLAQARVQEEIQAKNSCPDRAMEVAISKPAAAFLGRRLDSHISQGFREILSL